MTLSELKQFLGIPVTDDSQDAVLKVYLESGIEAAQTYCDRVDFMDYYDVEDGKFKLPGGIKLGIAEWVKASRSHADRGGVVSESIGGMSQSFSEDLGTLYAAAHAHWAPYHRAVKFFTAGRRR